MRRSRGGRRAGIGLLALGAAGVLAASSARAQSTPYTFRRTVRRVVVDVVVTDEHHNVIRGLNKGDFRVYEDDQEQDVRSFDAYNVDSDQAVAPPPVPALPPDTFVDVPKRPERGPLYVIVFDATNMGDPTDQTEQVYARAQLAKFLQSKPEGTRFELYYLGKDVRLAQGFTSDKQKLLDAFDVSRKEGHVPWVFLYGQNYGGADPAWPFQVMVFIAKNLEGLPGRKNLIWLSTKFPGLEMGPGNVPVPLAVLAARMHGTPSTNRDLASADMNTIQQEEFIREAVDSLNFAQVSVYPIDVRGETGEASWAGLDTTAQQLAAATGGQAYFNRNDLATAIGDATVNGGSYYEMTYEPPSHPFDGQQHTIKVTMTNPRYQLEYRPYYFDDDPDKPMTKEERRMEEATAGQVVAHREGDSMYAYMVHGAPEAHDVLFRAQLHAGRTKMATQDQMADLQDQPAFFVLRKRNKPVKVPPPIPLAPYTIDYLVIDQTAANHPGQVLEFAACAYDADGKMLNGLSQDAARAQGTQKAGGPPLFRAEQTLEVPTTAQWLRVAVRDVATDRIGTIEIRLPLAAQGAGGTAKAGYR
jgi:VWFA-related protein